MTPRGVRYNNPGNIVWTGSVLFEGETGKQPDSAFAIFDTPEHGIGAIGQNLIGYQDRHGCRTVNQFIRRWSATDQDAYVANVAKSLGVGPSDPIDIHNEATRRAMVVAIITQENGQQPYADTLINTALGIANTQPAAPIEDQGTPMADTDSNPFSSLLSVATPLIGAAATAFLGPLGGALVAAFSPLAQEKIANLINKHTDNPVIGQQVAGALVAAAQAVTQKQDPIEAVIAARTDPTVMAQVEQEALNRLNALIPLFDKVAEYEAAAFKDSEASKDAAAARQKSVQDVPLWQDRVFIVSMLVLVGVGILTYAVATGSTWSADNRTQVLQAYLMALTGVLGFWIGTTRSSSAKDAVISEMARSKG